MDMIFPSTSIKRLSTKLWSMPPPARLLAELEELQKKIDEGLKALKEML